MKQSPINTIHLYNNCVIQYNTILYNLETCLYLNKEVVIDWRMFTKTQVSRECRHHQMSARLEEVTQGLIAMKQHVLT